MPFADCKIKIISIFLPIVLVQFREILAKNSASPDTVSESTVLKYNMKETIRQVKNAEDRYLNFTELARKYIGSGEEYDVTTEDGYILKLFHVPGNASNPVLLCPGILSTPENFLIRGNTSLVYMWAIQGFDIWAMSYRGLPDSRRHIRLDPDIDTKFWQYSMHEIGIYDYKAIIDFIFSRTGQEQVSVVAHSEGTSSFFVLMSEKPEYNSKVKVFVALAPICFLRHSGSALTAIIKSEPVINPLLIITGSEEIFGKNSFAKKVIQQLCLNVVTGTEVCNNLSGYLSGFNPSSIEPGFIRTILGHFPAGTSRKNVIHFTHVYEHNNFVKYDYGMKNTAIYGSLAPPAYDLKKVTTKVALVVAKNDFISALKDVERLRSTLPNVVHFYMIKDLKFNHVDYMWGFNAHRVLYPHVIDILLKYS